MSHDHDHAHLDPASGDRRVSIAIWANALLTVAQIAGGLFAGSLALIADALHNFSDMASLVIAFAARKIARRPADVRMTFGYGRIEIVAGIVNYTTLILVGVYLIYEGSMRLANPPEVGGWTVVTLGAVALVIDALTAMLTWSMQRGSVNIRALFLHNLSDALASVGVVGGGVLILLYGWWVVDPIVTLVIAGYILYLSLTEIGGPIRTLMLGVPVLSALETVEGVAEIHHAHLWQIQETQAGLDAHVVLTRDRVDQSETVKVAIKRMLADHFGIHHSTLEFEHPDHAHEAASRIGCETAPSDSHDPSCATY